MKIRILAAAVLLCLGLAGCREEKNAENAASAESAAAPASAQGELSWVYTLGEGLALAKSGNKPVMVDFYADWCGWCKKLDRDVYTDPEVIALSKGFVNVKVDTDKYGQDAAKYGVQGLPTIVFLNADGSVNERIVGYSPAQNFAAAMKRVLKQ